MRLPKFVLAFGLMIALSGFAGLGAASAGDYCHAPRVHCGYKTVTVYVEREIAYRTKVVRYTDCGEPYYKWITRYRTIEIPKRIRIKTCDY